MNGWCPTSKDTQLYNTLCIVLNNDGLAKWPHLNRWYSNMRSFTQEERLAFPAAKAPFTSLAEKIEQLNNIRYISKDMLDKKVRRLLASRTAINYCKF